MGTLTGTTPFQSQPAPNFVFMIPSNCINSGPTALGSSLFSSPPSLRSEPHSWNSCCSSFPSTSPQAPVSLGAWARQTQRQGFSFHLPENRGLCWGLCDLCSPLLGDQSRPALWLPGHSSETKLDLLSPPPPSPSSIPARGASQETCGSLVCQTPAHRPRRSLGSNPGPVPGSCMPRGITHSSS